MGSGPHISAAVRPRSWRAGSISLPLQRPVVNRKAGVKFLNYVFSGWICTKGSRIRKTGSSIGTKCSRIGTTGSRIHKTGSMIGTKGSKVGTTGSRICTKGSRIRKIGSRIGTKGYEPFVPILEPGLPILGPVVPVLEPSVPILEPV